MEIEVFRVYHGYDLIIESGEDKIIIDAEERNFSKVDGELKLVGRDVCTDVLTKMVQATSDLIYWREKDFDSSDLVKLLFEKMPDSAIPKLLESLNLDYGE